MKTVGPPIKKKIIPAIIAKTQMELEEKVNSVKDFAPLLQLDVMDGEFVPNNSLDFDLNLPDSCEYEVHLMVSEPQLWIERFIDRATTVLPHIESSEKPGKLIDLVKRQGKRIGFAVNPKTKIERLAEYLGAIDQVLVMTVHPGFYGSPFLPQTLEKVRKLRELQPELDIEVDGGIKPETIKLAAAAGANLFVIGSYIIKSRNPPAAVEILRGSI